VHERSLTERSSSGQNIGKRPAKISGGHIQHAVGYLQAACADAVIRLHTIVKNDSLPSTVHVSASRVILELTTRCTEAEELLTRVSVLEKELTALRQLVKKDGPCRRVA
jgi:hypothetical protein